MPLKVSKNHLTIDQLTLACRHVDEMIEAGVTENLAIRTLELFTDVYAKILQGGSATPHHVSQVKTWSLKAQKLREALPGAMDNPGRYFRVEHGTPRRSFARKVRQLYQRNKLTARGVAKLVERDYKLAVITLDEDKQLNKLARSKVSSTPAKRWSAAGIEF